MISFIRHDRRVRAQGCIRHVERLGQGDQAAGNKLMEIVYQELRRLAAYYLQNEAGGHTLQATALVHELYLKLFSAELVQLYDHEHFLVVAARQLRHIVVDYARSKHAQTRVGLQDKLSLDDASALAIPTDNRILDLDEALQRLEKLDPRASQVVELRFFGGLTVTCQGPEYLSRNRQTRLGFRALLAAEPDKVTVGSPVLRL